ncbi:MAG: ornithine cyclodeaminase family protein [Crocinitomicaceae bacterium]|nr:ornithine cyclodeaminase family protein [Crocinitomicaceae bacterium]
MIPFIDDSFIKTHTDFPHLVARIEAAFSSSETIVPMRHHHDFPNGSESEDSTLLLMPAWTPQQESGVKIVTVSPNNAKSDLPSIHGLYVHLDSATGKVLSILNARELTAKRTAATSALASKYLSRENADTLLVIGTGALSENLIRAHASVRPIETVMVYGRNISKSEEIAKRFKNDDLEVRAINTIEEGIGDADIISCATLSATPLIKGKWLKEGQHVDLVGAYKPNMREADDDVIRRGTIYVDTMEGGLKESGDIVIPLESGLLQRKDIVGDLFSLCSEVGSGRKSTDEITVFKSVGYALEDLVGASYYYEQWKEQ